MDGGDLSQQLTPSARALGWSWHRRMLLPRAGGAALSRGVGQELLHPWEERNRESLWEQQGFIQRHPPALCNGEISWDPQELREPQGNPQEKPHQIFCCASHLWHFASVVGRLVLPLFLAMSGGRVWRGGEALLAPGKFMVSILV